jgi:hypothetical protein
VPVAVLIHFPFNVLIKIQVTDIVESCN